MKISLNNKKGYTCFDMKYFSQKLVLITIYITLIQKDDT